MTTDLIDWAMDLENKEARKLTEIMTSHARKLQKALQASSEKDDQYAAVFAFYRKFYTLTLCKSCLAAGINKSPTRDIILDYPWKDLKLSRFFCLKIWEKINQ